MDPPEVDIAQNRLKAQINTIDRWLRSGIYFSEGTASIAARNLQKAERLPPFQGGKESEKDATLIFSTLEQLTPQEQPTLFFVSANTTDFSHKDKGEHRLHPSILARFPFVAVKYFESLNRFVDYAIGNSLLSRRPETMSDNNRLLQNFAIDKSLHPIDQLYNYLSARFRTIKFLPRSLYAPHYPFAVNTVRDLYDQPFTISTNNKDIYDFLQRVKINTGDVDISEIPSIDKVENGPEKIRLIMETLNFNFGHNVSWLHNSPKPITTIERQLSATTNIPQFQQWVF